MRRAATIVTVHVPKEEDIECAAGQLTAHGGHTIRWFGMFAIPSHRQYPATERSPATIQKSQAPRLR
ncbi:MAG: hypothetical protein KatS3mg060_0619 [Dehalococcoidia bacterium]|nr:MAG: hypothetical protein KatS3mg060_0619 [Dehalococcoidia bacterium]